MAIDLSSLRHLPPSELSERMDAAWSQVFEDKKAEDETPILFTSENTAAGSTIYLMAVQHDAGPRSMTISNDGNPLNAQRVPLLSKLDRPIVKLYHSEVEWTPERLGFLIVMVPGWLAVDRGFKQALSPQLCKSIEWTEQQRAAWAGLRRKWNHTRPSVVRSHRPNSVSSNIKIRDAF